MERVTINIEGPDLELVRQQAAEADTSLSAYVAHAARQRALADVYRAAAEAETAPSDEQIERDAARIAAKHAFTPRHSAVPGAA